MRNSMMAMLAIATAIAAGTAPVHAQSSDGMKSLGYNWNVTISGAQSKLSATVTIYDTLFNALTTDCLPAGTTRHYTGAYPAAVGAALYIRYQLFGAANACAGAELLDTSYGPELTGEVGNFPVQSVPAFPAGSFAGRTGPTSGGSIPKN